MVAYTYRMPAGIPGAVSRKENYTSEPQSIDATSAATYPLAYGKPTKTVAGLMQAIQSGDTGASVTGFLERAYPGNVGLVNDPLGTTTAQTSGLATRMKRGYMTTVLNYGTAAKDAPVGLRVVAATGPVRPIGNIESAIDNTNVVAIPGAVFMGPADAAGNVEIAYNI